MPSFNKVVLVGNLTRDPELKYLPNGTAVAQVGLAVNRSWTSESGEKKEEVTFVDITLWGKTAENTAKYMSKGGAVLVEGRLKLDQWEKDGQKFSKLKVIGESVVFLSNSKDEKSDNPEPRQPRRAEPVTAPVAGDEPRTDDDDVPF